jgi:hypothetical protein
MLLFNEFQCVLSHLTPIARKSADSAQALSSAEMQFTSLKTGLQNLQNRIQCASLGEAIGPVEGEAAKIMARIGDISCLGKIKKAKCHYEH